MSQAEEIVKQIDDELQDVCPKHVLGEVFESQEHLLNKVAREARNIGSRYAQEGKIKGFVLDVNGVDASGHVKRWTPESLKAEKVKLTMGVHVDGRNAQITHEFEAASMPVKPLEAPVKVAEPEQDKAEEFQHSI